MEIGDTVNIHNSTGGYWKGKITDILSDWTHPLKTGEVLQHPYRSQIVTVKGIAGEHATLHVGSLEHKDGEYYERRHSSP